MAGFRSFID